MLAKATAASSSLLLWILGASLDASEPPVRSAAELLDLVRRQESKLDGKHLDAQYTFSSTANKEGLRFVDQGYRLMREPLSNPDTPEIHASIEEQFFSGEMNRPGKKATVTLLCDMKQHKCSTADYSEEHDGQYLWVTSPLGSKPRLKSRTSRPFPLPQKLLLAAPLGVSEWGFPSGGAWDTSAISFVSLIEAAIKDKAVFTTFPSKTNEDCWVASWAQGTWFTAEIEFDAGKGHAIRRCRTSRHRTLPADEGEIVESIFDQYEELAPGMHVPKRITATGRVSLAYHFGGEPGLLKVMSEKIRGLPDAHASLVMRTHVIEFEKLKLVDKPLVLDTGAFGE